MESVSCSGLAFALSTIPKYYSFPAKARNPFHNSLIESHWEKILNSITNS
jgi:hypothetical protein